MRIGSDLQSLTELRRKTALLGNRSVFTAYERAYCDARPDPYPSLGGIFCAKEASIKALAGYADVPSITFLDLEIRHASNGRPVFSAGARLAPWMAEHGVALDVSISHSADYVTATVVATRDRAPEQQDPAR